MVKSLWLTSLLLVSWPLVIPPPVAAHAFGIQYTLPIPLWMYLWGGGVVVAISFLLIGYFLKFSKKGSEKIGLNISQNLLLKFFRWGLVQTFFKSLSLVIFSLTILAGFMGSPEPASNFTTVFFWILFYLGFIYLSALVGNFWIVVNPWRILTPNFSPKLNYPSSLGYYPALLFYFLLIWLELLSNGIGVNPPSLAGILIFYTGINFLGSIIFGKENWFKYGEFFSALFELFSKISPIQKKENKFYLQIPFSKLLEERVNHFSLVIFILFSLSSTAFDGFRSTSWWLKLVYLLGGGQIISSLMLGASLVLFLSLYLSAIYLMKLLVKTKLAVFDLASKFAYSLLPIALVYNLAHYYSLLLIQGQSIISLVSDPLNRGWNLFGSSDYVINIGIIGAKFIWNSQVLLIISGHIVAVFLAHSIALRLYKDRKSSLVSQLPMLTLMVFYTTFGLWLLSQPLRVGG